MRLNHHVLNYKILPFISLAPSKVLSTPAVHWWRLLFYINIIEKCLPLITESCQESCMFCYMKGQAR